MHTQEIEVILGDIEIYVDVTYSARLVDNSFGYSYGSINAIQEEWGWDDVTMEWDRDKYTPELNRLIEAAAQKELDNALDKIYDKLTSY